MRVLRLTQPASEPVTTAQAKAHLRVDDTASDNEIDWFISVARQRVEDFCNRAFCEATFAVLYDGDLPSGGIALSVPMPGATVDAITYRDTGGAIQSFTDYTYDAERQEITPDDAWPDGENLRVAITAGDDGAPPVVPYPIYSAILLYVGDLFENRLAQVEGSSFGENRAAEALMMPYRERMGI